MSISGLQGDVFQAIDRLAVGDYSSFAGRLVGSDDPRPTVGADALLDAAMRAAIEARFARRFDRFDQRAVHSIWMKWYLNAFLPPVLLADLLLLRRLPVALDNTRFIIGDDMRVAAVRIDGVPQDTGEQDTGEADPFWRFESLIFDHFEPLIAMWVSRTDVTRRVFWSNVGNTFEAMLRRVAAVSGSFARLEQARGLLNEPAWRDGRANPLFDAVYDVAENGALERRRRVCCIQYLLPDRRFCKACPVEEARTASHSHPPASTLSPT
jgi:ferric iron reductase protein FhuF